MVAVFAMILLLPSIAAGEWLISGYAGGSLTGDLTSATLSRTPDGEIVLLSDGVPNRGKLKRTDQILEAIKLLNGGRVRIHTVSMLDEPSELLAELAKQNGGRHVKHPVRK